MKTLTTLALLTALVVGTSANANEYIQDVDYYNGSVRTGMCGTGCCAPTCRPACPTDCSYTSCCPTYHQKCVRDECNPCAMKTVCCRDVKGIFSGWLGW